MPGSVKILNDILMSKNECFMVEVFDICFFLSTPSFEPNNPALSSDIKIPPLNCWANYSHIIPPCLKSQLNNSVNLSQKKLPRVIIRYWGSYSAVYPEGGSGSSAEVAFDVANLQEASRQSLTAAVQRGPAPSAPASRAPAPRAPAPRAPAPRAPAPKQQRLNWTLVSCIKNLTSMSPIFCPVLHSRHVRHPQHLTIAQMLSTKFIK